ncbi:MAG: hypothetical protein ACSLE5_03255 [Porticoccaceae bacterium]
MGDCPDRQVRTDANSYDHQAHGQSGNYPAPSLIDGLHYRYLSTMPPWKALEQSCDVGARQSEWVFMNRQSSLPLVHEAPPDRNPAWGWD